MDDKSIKFPSVLRKFFQRLFIKALIDFLILNATWSLAKRGLATGAKFSLARGDSQISFNKGVYPGDLVYQQYCLLLAPYQLIKIPFLFHGCYAVQPLYIFIGCPIYTNWYDPYQGMFLRAWLVRLRTFAPKMFQRAHFFKHSPCSKANIIFCLEMRKKNAGFSVFMFEMIRLTTREQKRRNKLKFSWQNFCLCLFCSENVKHHLKRVNIRGSWRGWFQTLNLFLGYKLNHWIM